MELNEKDEDIEHSETVINFLREIRASPSKFCKAVLGLKPYPYQEKFLEDKSKYIVACAGRQVGKSLISAAKALWFSRVHRDTTTLIVSSTQRQSSLMFDKILKYVDASDPEFIAVQRKTRTMIRLENGSEMIALPCGRHGNSLRGHTAHLIIVDEAAFVPEEVIKEVLTPMLATTGGSMIMLSTPYDKGHYFYQAFNSSNWSKYHFKTSDNPKVSKEFLEQQREEIGELQFRQEYLAEFVDDEDTYFPMTLLHPSVHVCEGPTECKYCSLIAKEIEPSGELYAGYDPGGMTDPAAFVLVEKLSAKDDAEGGSKKGPAFRVVLTKTFLSRKAKEKKQNDSQDVYTQFTVEIADFHKKFPFQKLVVDSAGIGSPILEHCKQLRLPVDGVNLGQGKQSEILSNLKMLFEQQKITLPNSLDLLSSLNCITAKRNRVGGYIFDHANGTHDDLAYALALAVYGAKLKPTIIILKADKESQGIPGFHKPLGIN
jgi:phage terminase large subunit-like protein